MFSSRSLEVRLSRGMSCDVSYDITRVLQSMQLAPGSAILFLRSLVVSVSCDVPWDITRVVQRIK